MQPIGSIAGALIGSLRILKEANGDMEVTTDPIILKLTPEDALRLMRILLDEDKDEALLFLKQCLKPRLDQAGRGRLVRSFEAP